MKIAPLDRNPYVFVVGCPRSGTTLLQRMLDCHPRLAVANDTHFITRVVQRLTDGMDPPLTSDLIEKVLHYKRFPRLGLSEAVVLKAAARARTYGEFVSVLYSEYGRLREKPLAGEKTPDYVRYLPLLHALFPWVRIIHIIRDGRDVTLSMRQWAREGKGPGRFELWREDPLAVCALWWRWHVATGRRDGAGLGPFRYREVKYEDLVARPDETLRGIATFLELPFAPEMLAYYVGKTRYAPGLSSKKAWLPPTPGLRDWRTQMGDRDVALFEAIAGDLLAELGYERAVDTTPPEIAAIAERYRRWWDSRWWDSEMAHRQAKESGSGRSRRDSARS